MPTPRISLYLSKLAAGCTLIAGAGAAFLLTVAFSYGRYRDDPTAIAIPLPRLLLAAASLFGVGIVFLSFGALTAVLLRRIRSVSGIATAYGVLAFMLVSLPEMTGEDAYRIVAPFTWFNIDEAMNHGHYEAGYLILAAVVALACLTASAIAYARGDVEGL